jgi:hypothetical protein
MDMAPLTPGRCRGAAGRPWVRLLLATGTLACADFDGISDPRLADQVIEVPEFARDIVPIFERRCAIGGCHTPGAAQAGLVLSPDDAHGALVNQPSHLRPDRVRVIPGDADASWLMTMLREDQAARGGFSRMPLASRPLTPNQLATIANWIDRGAPPE